MFKMQFVAQKYVQFDLPLTLLSSIAVCGICCKILYYTSHISKNNALNKRLKSRNRIISLLISNH